MNNRDVREKLSQLENEGYLLIEGALSPEETEHLRQRINYAREQGWEEGLNDVGNMWFDTLLDREPDTYQPLVGHPNVRPYLEGMMGKQCQLRSLRAHINPGAYLQEWHLDFYGYWHEKREAEKYPYAVSTVSFNSTFYFQNNQVGDGHLKFVKNGHQIEPEHLYPVDRPKFEAWCEAQAHVVLHPMAGDCVIFMNHMPHQGAKERDDMERSNVVCHYQVTPMHDAVHYVSRPRGYIGTFPFAD